MSAEKLLFNAVILLLIIFTFNRYLILQKTALLIMLTGQFFALVLSLEILMNSVNPNLFMEVLMTILGIVIPGIIFFYFYFINKEGKIKEFYQAILKIFVKESNNKIDESLMIEDGSKDKYGLGCKMTIVPEKTADILLRGYSFTQEIPHSVKEGFAEAEQFVELKAWRKAFEKYHTIQKQCGDNPALLFNMGNIYYHLKEYQKAINFYNAAAEMNLVVNQPINTGSDQEASHKTAAKRIKSALKKVEDYEVVFNIAVCLACQGKYEKSVEMFKKAGVQKDNWINIYKPLSIIYEALGNNTEAAEMYQNLAEIYPEDFEMQRKAGNLSCTVKNYDKAKEYYDRANVLQPDFYQGYLNIGIKLLGDNRNNEAIQMFELVCKISTDIAEVHYNLGNAYYANGQKMLALSAYKRAIEINPNDYKALYNLGVILDEMDMQEEAVMAYENTLDIKPDFYDASNNLSLLLCSLERYDRAVENYLKALQYNPSNIELYFNLAITLEYQKKYDQAEELYRKIIKMNPKSSDAYYNIGLIRAQKEDIKGAEQYFRKAVEYNSEYHKSYYQLAKIYVVCKEYGKCIECLRKAIELSEDYINKAKIEKVFDTIRNLKSYENIVQIC
ncbi:MAG: tetratricopeptide repeat protein [Deltaproteobacteria bacterium]